jgi:2-haloacid dehalogenase
MRGFSPPMSRWATFDCYGTLIDWNGGIGRELARLFGGESAARLLVRFHALEPDVQSEAFKTYREVLKTTLERLAAVEKLPLAPHDAAALANSLPNWKPFPEVPAALEALRKRGWRLCILSNTDRDLMDASIEQIGVRFDGSIVAEEIGSYKPSHGHWKHFFERTGADRSQHVHVGASLFHDIAPANELGIPSVWINRLGETATNARPTRELTDLSQLPDTLDGLLPRRRLSKWLSYVLRHRPDEAGLVLDARGYAPIEALLAAARTALGMEVTVHDLEALAQPPLGDKKKRFEIDGDFMRAGHGHSIALEEYEVIVPRGPLYHGAPRSALDAILQAGLQPMSRQKVHLSYDRAITMEAARRKGSDVVSIEIDVEKARAANVRFYRSADARIVLADAIPADALIV